MSIEVRCVNGDELDEFFAKGADIHIERMDTGHWWMSVDCDGKSYMLNFGTKRNAAIHLLIEEDETGGKSWESKP